MNSLKENINRKPNPILKANFISKWFFFWTHEIFRKGLRDELEEDVLYAHLPSLDSKKVSYFFIKYWEYEVRRKKPSLLKMIFRSFGWRFVPVCILYSILEISLHSFQPIFLGQFVSYFTQGQTDISTTEAYLYAMGIVLCSLVACLCFHPFMFYLFEVGTRIRLACAGLVYRKCLRTSVTSENCGMSSFAIAVLSTDLPQFDISFYFFHDLWKGPIEAIVFGCIMYQQIGWVAVLGIVAIIVFIPLQTWAAKAAAKYRYLSAEYGDDRIRLMNEIIMAIQVIKMYAWEKSFAKLVATVRKKEIKAIRGSMNIYAALQCTSMISKLSLFISLVAYVYTGEIVTAKKVFLISSYYSVLNDSLLSFWPLAITTWAETVICARRVVTFLLQSEDPADGGIENIGVDEELKGNFIGRVHNARALRKDLLLCNVSASWDKVEPEKRRPHVQDISFYVSEKQFVGIIGNSGSGKSTLLNAILGELEILHGNIEVNGVISYASQEAWIFEGSIRDNIVFVEKYNARRYKEVVKACQLERDLQLLPFGDATIVGEHGINLSVGQKARVSLARAVYKEADIYIFDDPLSAVDSHVGQKLLEKCFLEFLNEKMRIVVTHHVQHLKHADLLILMEGGCIETQGVYNDLKSTIRFRMHLDNESDYEHPPPLLYADSVIDDEREPEEMQSLAKDDAKERKEQQIHGSVKLQTYLTYFAALKLPWIVVAIFGLFVVARVCEAAMDVFISKWATWEESSPGKNEDDDEYNDMRGRLVIMYTCFMVSTLILYIVRSFGFFFMCLKISLHLHDNLFNGVIRACMSFFRANPSGRILNRFSSDITNIDIELPRALMDTLDFVVDAIAVMTLVAVANYWLVIPAVIIILVLYLCRRLFIAASRSLNRIEAMTRSPIYSHTNQTFQGLTTIRALNATQAMEKEFHSFQNRNTSALYLYVTTNRAFAFWTDLICVLYILIVTFSFLVVSRNFYSGDVGLAITQSMSLIIMCQWGMRQTAELENQMTSVERVTEYAMTQSEPPLETDASIQLSKNWPHFGQIIFKDLRFRYSEKDDFILKGLNFSILPMEKVGIVGRTGAGKSSITQAIFRLGINEGLIEIDGHDIEKLGLHDLRSRISIIPQDPILVSGTLRYNLDPFEERTDAEIWSALADVKLKALVSAMEGGLACRMRDGGVNFSMGHRQLICMARAILRHNKILILDEATAYVDPDTDRLIQEAIHTRFEMCTVLTIAHRLHTVMDNDRVLVIDAGDVVELGHPYELLQNRSGFLSRLVAKTGSGTARNLRIIAEESYKKRVLNKKTE